MARADRRERRREVPVDAVAQADDDARGQARLRLRDRGREGIASPPPDRLEPRRGLVARVRRSRGRASTGFPRRRSAPGSRRTARPVAVRPSRRREPGRPVRSRGYRGRVAATRTGPVSAAASSASRSTMARVATCWPSRGDPTVTTPADPRPVVGRKVCRGRWRERRHAQGDRRGPDGQRDQRADPRGSWPRFIRPSMGGPEPGDADRQRRGQEDQQAGLEAPSREARGDGADRQPEARGHAMTSADRDEVLELVERRGLRRACGS